MPATPEPRAPALVVLNARSGAGGGGERAQQLRELFAAAHLPAEVLLAESGEELVAGTQRALAAGTRLVVAAGGDGTQSAVASCLAGTDAVQGVLPMGTLNHFAKDLNLPLEVDAAIDVLAQGHVVAIDVGEVNGRIFINNSSIGLYPDIVLDREQQRKRLGRGKWQAMLAASLDALRRFHVMSLQLEVDGKLLRRHSPFVFIGNNEYRMEGFEIGARAGLTDGRLSLYTTQRTGRWGLFLLAWRALFHRLHQAQDFDMLGARQVLIRTRRPRIRVATDGEVVKMDTPLHYKIRTGALRVVVPQSKT